ncbi:uncharacterized protein SCHCODRAFT_02613345 [Schizophyllum commune H4-8]|uniref:uncharacterized protein n=1 Tax=Schizophyllum commune (strain H4-8 / FGSC 9210) TaxID=578458 RepID=UPI00215EC1A8|nr:uncharacterized protein SCHCODRAFT_02613345 [Schizophyllum commune H4-8]KAI5898849.1 hypothetical protein SCHCODRAFT_02613345 [Schizophyllum commune H4-8]
MSKEAKLPHELLDGILGHLYADRDIPSLATCALAHRSLYYISQALLFRDILVEDVNTAVCLGHALRDYPHLRAYVHVLRFVETFDGPWVWEKEVLAGILDRAQRVEELHIHATYPKITKLNRETHTAFIEATARPSLRSVTIGLTIISPHSTASLALPPQLRDLRLSWTLPDSWEGQHIQQPAGLASLTVFLKGTDFLRFFTNEKCLLTDSRLRSLRLNVYIVSQRDRAEAWHSRVAAFNMVSRCADSLQSLELGCRMEVRALFPGMKEKAISLPQLRLLALRDVDLLLRGADQRTALSTLLALIFTIAPNVTHVAIHFDPQLRLVTSASILAQLADLLDGEHAPRALRSVKVLVLNAGSAVYSCLERPQGLVKALSMKKVDIEIEPSKPRSVGEVHPPLLPLSLIDEAEY